MQKALFISLFIITIILLVSLIFKDRETYSNPYESQNKYSSKPLKQSGWAEFGGILPPNLHEYNQPSTNIRLKEPSQTQTEPQQKEPTEPEIDLFAAPTSPFIKCKLNSVEDIKTANKLEKTYTDFNKDLAFLIKNKLFKENKDMYSQIAFKVYENNNRSKLIKKDILKIIDEI